MKIRDSHASIQGEFSAITMPSGGLEVIGDDGRTLYTIKLDGGKLHVSAGVVCKLNGVLLDDKLSIAPHSRNSVVIERPKYES
jgi:hypothetical protein